MAIEYYRREEGKVAKTLTPIPPLPTTKVRERGPGG